MTAKVTAEQLESLQNSLDQVINERKAFTGKDETLIKMFNEKLSTPIRAERDLRNFSYKDDGDFLVLNDSRAPNSPAKFRYNELVDEVGVSSKENINKMLDSLGFAKRRT